MISSKLRIERWGNQFHGFATVTGSTYVIEGPNGRVFSSLQAVVDAAHERFPIAVFEIDFQVMAPDAAALGRGLRNALLVTLFFYFLVASLARWWPFP